MQKFIVQGKNKIGGTICVAGDKNTALKIIPACVLVKGKTTLKNVPNIEDVKIMLKIIESIGGRTTLSSDKHEVIIDTTNITKTSIPDDLATKARASILFTGSLLGRLKKAEIHHPGGDVIGQRPIDILVDGLSLLNTKIKQKDKIYEFSTIGLKGACYVFRIISVTVTENLILAATLAKGTTEIINAAQEPSVIALADFLNKRGAKIIGAGSPVIKIEGVKELKNINEPTIIIPDRIEAGTFACLAAATNSEIVIKNCEPHHMDVFLKHLELMGVKYKQHKSELKISKINHKLKAIDVVTHEYPGFATDYQAPFTVLLTQAQGVSLVHETIWEGRLFYTDKLKQMGAKIIMADPHRVIIEGPSKLVGRKIISPDIRAGIGLVIAGILAEGETTIGNIYQIDRGYENIDQRLRDLGVNIKRVETDYF